MCALPTVLQITLSKSHTMLTRCLLDAFTFTKIITICSLMSGKSRLKKYGKCVMIINTASQKMTLIHSNMYNNTLNIIIININTKNFVNNLFFIRL